jgi:hypothetical protein
MKRREFMSLLGSAAAARALAARAQRRAGRLRAFRQGLSETGYPVRESSRNLGPM